VLRKLRTQRHEEEPHILDADLFEGVVGDCGCLLAIPLVSQMCNDVGKVAAMLLGPLCYLLGWSAARHPSVSLIYEYSVVAHLFANMYTRQQRFPILLVISAMI
jgi:p-aminobenzoyl-glutamate transporter AbgT